MPMTDIDALRRNWWTLVLRGIFAVAFGLFAWLWPRATLLALILTWGTWASVAGIITLVSAFSRNDEGPRGLLLLEGGISLVAGVIALIMPRSSALFFLYLLGIWALVSGIVEIVAAWRVRGQARGGALLGVAGVLSASFGLVLLLRPGAGILAFLWLISSFSVLYGCVLLAWGFYLRRGDVPRFQGSVEGEDKE